MKIFQMRMKFLIKNENKGLKMKTTMIKGLVLATVVTIPTTSMAIDFYKSGTVSRIIVHTASYGKCMLQLPVTIGNGCSGNYVSLDCEGKYLDKGDGDRMLNVALIAQTMEKSVTVQIDSTKKYDGYCVAKRIDILK